MSKEKVDQHYVPCCYLKNFSVAPSKKRKSMVYAYDIESKKYKYSTVEKFAYEKYFYDIPVDKHRKIIEEVFISIEGEYSTLLGSVINMPMDSTIDAETKSKLAAQFALQKSRTRNTRDFFSYVIQEAGKVTPFQQILDDKKHINDYAKNLHNREILSLKSSNFYANAFEDKNWVIWRNDTETPFYSSDNPVCIIYHGSECIHSPVAKEAEIYVPISPKIAISMFHKSLQVYDRSVAVIKDSRIINSYNIYLAQDCTRFIFSNTPSFDSFKQI